MSFCLQEENSALPYGPLFHNSSTVFQISVIVSIVESKAPNEKMVTFLSAMSRLRHTCSSDAVAAFFNTFGAAYLARGHCLSGSATESPKSRAIYERDKGAFSSFTNSTSTATVAVMDP